MNLHEREFLFDVYSDSFCCFLFYLVCSIYLYPCLLFFVTIKFCHIKKKYLLQPLHRLVAIPYIWRCFKLIKYDFSTQ